jgi:hypothetical protein
MIQFVVPRSQDFGLLEFLDYWGDRASGPFHVVHYESLAGRSTAPGGTWVLSALDQLTTGGKRLVRELESQLRASDSRASVLNSVDTTLLRGDLLQRLHQHGLNRHTAVRATASSHEIASLRFPVFLREEHEHTGVLSVLIRDRRELTTELAKSVVRGYHLDDLLIVEFCDTRSADGCYRKYAAFAIGSTIVPQFVSQDTHWMLKLGKTEHTPEIIAEEFAWVSSNPHEQELRRIAELGGVQYGRIDYAIADGAVETWEINLNPTLARYPSLPPHLESLRRPTTELFHERFHAAFRAAASRPVSEPTPAGKSSEIAIHFSDENRRASAAMIRARHEPRFPDALVRALRPVRPLIDWVVRVVSPVLVRAAGR